MNIAELSKAIWNVHRMSVGHDVGSDCKPGEDSKKCKKNRRKRPYSVFPVLYPGHMGTPKSGQPYSSQPEASTSAVVVSEEKKGEPTDCRPSRVRVIHEMKKSMGLLEFGGATNPDPSWGGFSVPNLGTTQIRSDGPAITGPGFKPSSDVGKGGRYDFRKSPGLSFRTEMGWRIWDAALTIIDKDKTATKTQILMQAIQKAGVNRGQIDPAELRLLEMGIEWYLTSPGALASRRGAGAVVDTGGSFTGVGAP